MEPFGRQDSGDDLRGSREGFDGEGTSFLHPGVENHPRPVARPVRVSATAGKLPVPGIVSYPLYNSFNYSVFLPKDHEKIRLSLGVTSPNPGEGKTTAVCNLAAALATGSGRKTVVVDLNIARPRLHEVFGTPRGPGLGEALIGGEICVVPAPFDNLYVMPIGNAGLWPSNGVSGFREVLDSLFNDFEFVIVDLPPTSLRSFPTVIANQLSGLLVVLRSRVTRRRDVNRLFLRIREEKVLGFFMNGFHDDDF